MAVAAFALVGVAQAAPKKKVKIESEPPGATVYFNSKEDGPVCTTPCTVDAPVGDTPIIVELENHKQLFENLVVSARKTPIIVKYKLMPAIGTINVRGPAGASITVDDVDKGKAPTKFDVPAGTHTVILTLNGKKATEFVDVPSSDEVVVEPKLSAEAKPPKKIEPDEDKDPEETNPVENTKTPPEDVSTSTTGTVEKVRERGPYFSIGAFMDVGFRSFEYDNPQTANLPPEKEGGNVMVGPVLEIFPLAKSRGVLRGLSLFFRIGFGVNPQAVKQNGMTTGANTFWRVFDLSLRERFQLTSWAVEVGGGFVRDQYQFSGDPDDILLVPDADYQTVRIGGRLIGRFGSVEPYFGLEPRLVLSGGALQKRFDSASANGVRVAAGADIKLGAFAIKLEGALNYYSWSFTSNESTDMFRADGGTDSVKYLSTSLGYAY